MRLPDLAFLALLSLPIGLACTAIDNPNLTEDASETTPTGDGDGDGATGTMTTDGDGDGDDPTTGDGDGDGDGGSCDVWLQDCGPNEKCMPYATEASVYDDYKCVPLLGDGIAGDLCTYDGPGPATDTCGPGLHCWDLSDPNIGTCTPLCAGSPAEPECGPDTLCSLEDDGYLPVCVAVCDPILQNCGDEGCFWNPNNSLFQCIPTTNDTPVGEECGFVNDCAAGLICMPAISMPNCPSTKCCASLCDVSDPTCPQAGTECDLLDYPGQTPNDYVDVGICVTPGAPTSP